MQIATNANSKINYILGHQMPHILLIFFNAYISKKNKHSQSIQVDKRVFKRKKMFCSKQV